MRAIKHISITMIKLTRDLRKIWQYNMHCKAGADSMIDALALNRLMNRPASQIALPIVPM